MPTILMIFIFFCYINSFGQSKVYGVVKDEITNKNLNGTHVYLFKFDSVHTYNSNNIYNEPYIQSDSIFKLIDSFYTDTSGSYQFELLTDGVYRIFGIYKLDKDETTITYSAERYRSVSFIIDEKGIIKKNFSLHVTCEFDSTRNLYKCPKCNKKDKVIEIRYGLWTLLEPDKEEYYYDGNCSPLRCSPTKFCKKCKLKF